MISERLTTEEMERLLAKLGFRQFPNPGPQRVFENAAFDAVLLLPTAGTEPFARTEHVITLHKTVIEKGIADEQTFDSLVSEVRRQTSDSMSRVS